MPCYHTRGTKMLNQSFEDKCLLKLTRKQEIIKFKLGRNIDDYKVSLHEISNLINDESFTFSTFSDFSRDGKDIYHVKSPEDYYAVKKISDNIKRLYRVKFSNKEDITSQVINIINDTSAFRIIRLDVKNFFESITFDEVLRRVISDNLLSFSSTVRLERLKNLSSKKTKGLPRGLSISSVLSEIFMENLDEKIRSHPSVYYYARYVDDIIIITHYDDIDLNYFRELFLINGLDLNDKSVELDVENVQSGNITKKNVFSFLGYSYIILNEVNSEGVRAVVIDLSESKVKKIKTRIIQSILSYSRTMDLKLLSSRMRFLSGNYHIKIEESKLNVIKEKNSGKLKGGIFYNNKNINSYEKLRELDAFLRSLIFSQKNNAIGRAIKKIPMSYRREISELSFLSGFSRTIVHDFSESEMNVICDCWR